MSVTGLLGCGDGIPPEAAPEPEARAGQLQAEDFDEAIGDDGGGVVRQDSRLIAGRRSTISPGQVPADRRAPPGQAIRARQVIDEDLRTRLSAMSPDASIRIFVVMEDEPFGWPRLRSRDAGLQRAIIDERKVQAGRLTAPAASRLAALGASQMKQTWLVPAVEAVVPVRQVYEIERLPGVRTISAGEVEMRAETEYTDAYSGLEGRNGMRTTAFIGAGLNGSSGGRSGGAIRVAHVTSYWDTATGAYDYISWKHRGFVYCSGGSCWYRTSHNRCSGGACERTPNPSDGGYNGNTGAPMHANTVMQVMAGSIESGSDGSVTDTTGRIRRSGLAPRTDLYYYVLEDFQCSSKVAAFERAVADQVDVLDLSASIGTCGCRSSCDTCGLNAVLANVRTGGMLFVKSLGNEGESETCNAGYPGHRRDLLTAAALDSSPRTAAYDTMALRSASGTGGLDITINGGLRSKALAVADLAAPGCWTYQYYYQPTNGYGPVLPTTGNFGCGTSFAAPAVAGAAAILRQSLDTLGWADDVGYVMASMLVMGDGWSWTTGAFKKNRFDKRSGAGRVHMHFPSSTNLVGPWAWGVHSANLADGGTVTFPVWDANPESPFITQWKVAMTWFDTNYDDASDIVLEVINTCANNAVVATDLSYDMRKRVTLYTADIANKCLAYKASAYHIPAGQIRTVYFADYYHSGTTASH